MKTYLFLILSFFSITCFAENWLNHSKILSGSAEAYSLKQSCENASNEKCYDLGVYPSSVYSEATLENEQKTIVLDQEKLSQWQAQEVVKAQARSKEAGVQYALRKIDCGKRVIALLVLRNAPKGLSTAQVGQLNSVYAPIKGLLETGSLVTAKEQIQAVSADGLLITDADKVDLANETQKCIELN